jgi:hypothetical protein
MDGMLPLATSFFSGFESGMRKAVYEVQKHQVDLILFAHQKTLHECWYLLITVQDIQ